MQKRIKFFKISDEEKDEYFLLLLKGTADCECFTWRVFENWNKNGWTTLASMNDYWMVKINLSKIKEAYSILVDENLNKSSFESLNINYQEAYLKIFKYIFNILHQQNFYKPIEGAQTTKSKYLNNIQHLIKNYSNSKEWSEHEKIVIKAEKKLNYAIFDLLKKNKFLKEGDTFIEFDDVEIRNLQKIDDSFFKGKLISSFN